MKTVGPLRDKKTGRRRGDREGDEDAGKQRENGGGGSKCCKVNTDGMGVRRET